MSCCGDQSFHVCNHEVGREKEKSKKKGWKVFHKKKPKRKKIKEGKEKNGKENVIIKKKGGRRKKNILNIKKDLHHKRRYPQLISLTLF
jgi:hypothetical protein